jgi:tight adherence protein B
VIENIRERQACAAGADADGTGRMARWVVSLPLGLLLVISFVNPTYMKPLFTHASGRVMIAVGAIMIVTGSLVIKKIVDIKV